MLVHGIAVSSRYMVPTIRALAHRFFVLAPDLPGSGRSHKPREALDVPQLADVLARWIETRGVSPCVLVGNSFGCQVVVECAVRHPHLVRALVLAGPTVDPAAPTVAAQVSRWAVNALREPLSLVGVVVREVLDWGPRRVVVTFGYGLRDEIETKLPRVVQPTLVVRGSRDVIAPQPWTTRAAELLPRGRHAVIAGAPHAVNWNAPVRFARLIADLVDELDDSSASA